MCTLIQEPITNLFHKWKTHLPMTPAKHSGSLICKEQKKKKVFSTSTLLQKCKIRALLIGLQAFPMAHSLAHALHCFIPPPLQPSIHPSLQPSTVWWVSCHCLSLQLWTQLSGPDGLISTSSSLIHDVYEGAPEPQATDHWPRSVLLSLSQNNMKKDVSVAF